MPDDRSSSQGEKKTILFNCTKKETHHPNAGFKKLARRLKANFKISSNKDEISKDRLAEANLLVFGGPREQFSTNEFEEIKNWLSGGGRCLILLGEGGEKEKSNMNYLLEEYGMSINNDSVLRNVFYKYLHPKEVFIAEGVLVPDLARKKVVTNLVTCIMMFTHHYSSSRRIRSTLEVCGRAHNLNPHRLLLAMLESPRTSCSSCTRTVHPSTYSAPRGRCYPRAQSRTP
jgi:hypothetical protein